MGILQPEIESNEYSSSTRVFAAALCGSGAASVGIMTYNSDQCQTAAVADAVHAKPVQCNLQPVLELHGAGPEAARSP